MLALLNLFRSGILIFIYCKTDTSGTPLNSFRECHILMLDEELIYIASLATRKALIYLLCRADREGRMSVIMEWTQSYIIDTSFLQINEFGYNILNVYRILYVLNSILKIHSWNRFNCRASKASSSDTLKYFANCRYSVSVICLRPWNKSQNRRWVIPISA